VSEHQVQTGSEVRKGDGALQLRELTRAVRERERSLRLLGVRGSSGAFITARLRAGHTGTLLVIGAGPARAERLAEDLRTFSGGAAVQLFPAYDTPPFDRFSPHPEIEARRMSLLYQLLCAESEPGLTVVAPWSALIRRVLPRDELRARVTHLERGMTVDRDALLDVLVAAGYHRTALVEERGEVASRGGILDLFPPQLEQPARLEFDFDEIGSIRLFDASTQRSDRELRGLVAIPPRPFRLQSAGLDGLIQRVRSLGRAQRVPESNVYAITEALARRHAPPGLENLEALLHEQMENLFDYLPPQTLVVVDDPEAGRGDAAAVHEEVLQGHAAARRQDRLVCAPGELYLEDGAAWEAVLARQPVLLDSLGARAPAGEEDCLEVGARDHRALRSEVLERRGSGRALEPLSARLERWQEQGQSVRIACPTLSAAERFADILRDYGHELPLASGARADWEAPPPAGRPEIAVASLHEGFELPGEGLVVLTEEDVFGTRVQRRIPRPLRHGEAIDRLAQIQEGDYLVHTEHGIGRYGGLTQLQLGGVRQEFLLLHYDQGDKLYLPISRLAQVQRYTASDEHPPFLDRLGGQRWARAKRRVKRAVRDMARELVAIYAAREVLAGHAVPIGAADYEEFEAGFPYEDTPDQRRATQEVLVCGDVGFGKTEIACRAAYAVAVEGRQVAFLVPTTVLCQQHLQTLRERFDETPIEVAALSRLSSPAEARAVREGLSSGRIDIVVGTHRLLSRDVRFRNLGLLIIDEEHRFGVAHKEKLKQLRKLVDVLTLSATPIPRTLEMALSGLRDLSVISTPPPDRTAIRTQVCRRSDEVAQDAIRRELRRGGQVFVVHNRVETIGEYARYIGSLVPEARIGIAHGQMAGRELESVMLSFLARKFDVLVCTAIIESGLDIPNANTIIIDRADRFGLAQLYQLRGRVGRSERRAYAYLFLPEEGMLTDDARRRIEAIQELSELGAGFRLAMSDLEIRGAGNLLGANQSGHIHAVGYDLYVEMLAQAVAELRGESVDEEVEPEIRLPIPALLPETYVADVNQRLVLYKQLSSARDEAELRELRADMMDRFGPLPREAETLIEVIRLKIGCRRLGIASISTEGRELVLRVADRTRVDPNRLLRVINRPGSPYRVTPEQRIHLKLRKAEDALAESFGALELLGLEPGEPVEAPRRDARGSVEGSA
jgi:transcription-repair coupling factor (superfamily II helicase)